MKSLNCSRGSSVQKDFQEPAFVETEKQASQRSAEGTPLDAIDLGCREIFACEYLERPKERSVDAEAMMLQCDNSLLY